MFFKKVMTEKDFKTICRNFIPNCVFRDKGTCGICCYSDGGNDIFYIKAALMPLAALLPDGRLAIYDKWRDITITDDINKLTDWLYFVSKNG